MWDRKILPRLELNITTGSFASTVDHTVIGQFRWDAHHQSAFPHGAIYTVTWDIVELLPKLQDQFHVIAGEDLTLAWLLMKVRQKVNMVLLSQSENFEFEGRDTRRGGKTA